MEIKFFFALFLQLMLISSSSTQSDTPSSNQDLVAATNEMQKANYFAFVMLIKMSPSDIRLEENVTFLMPNDRILANMIMLQQGSISNFLLRHSIPSPLLFDTLKQFPTGTTIPTSLPNCMLRVSNNGRKNFVLNNVKIISPNVCVAGSSIRCHGIDGVLSEDDCVSFSSDPSPPPLPPCPNGTDPSSCKALPPIPSPSSPNSAPPSPINSDNNNISPPPPSLIAPSPIESNVGPVNSGSSSQWVSFHGSFNFIACLILSLIGIYL